MRVQLWQYSFMLIAFVYQVKGHDSGDFFPKAAEVELGESEAFHINEDHEAHDEFVSRSAPYELSAQSPRGLHGLRRPITCYYSPDKGDCLPKYPRFYYDPAVGNCRMFLWSGCGGNGNRFLTHTQCMRTCKF